MVKPCIYMGCNGSYRYSILAKSTFPSYMRTLGFHLTAVSLFVCRQWSLVRDLNLNQLDGTIWLHLKSGTDVEIRFEDDPYENRI